MSFPPSSAGGHDGLSPRHLRDLTCFSSGAQGTRLLNAITELTRVIVRGSVPPPVARLLCGAKLIAFTKKGGGARPIAVGCTFRRLASKVACQFATDRFIDQLLPVQLGVAVPAGAEAAVHAARAYSRNGINKGTAMVKLDMENAFNSICRTAMTEVVHQHIPEIYLYVSLCYDQSSMLLLSEFQVKSADGVQQDDPLGPLLFALKINHLAHSSSSELSIWYLDDCCIGGEIDQLTRDIKNISEMDADIGLFLRTDKCEIISDDQEDASRLLTVLPGEKTTATDPADILGSPIGNLSNLETFLSKAIDQLRLIASRLLHIARHDALFILSRCLSLPKIAYLLRTSPCFKSVLTRDFDNCVRSTLSEVLNLRLSDTAWKQAILPIRFGGLGIQSATEVAIPAFSSSISVSSDLVLRIIPPHIRHESHPPPELIEAHAQWTSVFRQVVPTEINSQKRWTALLHTACYQQLLNSCSSPNDRARS